MKLTKKMAKQFDDFKAVFADSCRAAGGVRHERGELAGENSAFLIPCLWGKLRASIHAPIGQDRNYSSAAIFLQFVENDGERPFSIWGDFNDYSHKWNIHRSFSEGGLFVDCCNSALEELWRRLDRVTGKTINPFSA